MKGFIKKTAFAVYLGTTLFTLVGCYHYRELVDPCWPERYNVLARGSVREMNANQTAQGHMLGQTVWNDFFEFDPETREGTAVLNEAGKEYLRVLSRRQPAPDHHLYVQYPHDIKAPGNRQAVVEQRKAAIKNFLTLHTMGGNGESYTIDMHDFVMPTFQADWTARAIVNIEKNIESGKPQKFDPISSGSGSGK